MPLDIDELHIELLAEIAFAEAALDENDRSTARWLELLRDLESLILRYLDGR